jgi:hypothetical protein
MTSSKSTDIRATIVLDKHGHVKSMTSRCADIIGPGVDDFLKDKKFRDFLLNFSEDELAEVCEIKCQLMTQFFKGGMPYRIQTPGRSNNRNPADCNAERCRRFRRTRRFSPTG